MLIVQIFCLKIVQLWLIYILVYVHMHIWSTVIWLLKMKSKVFYTKVYFYNRICREFDKIFDEKLKFLH